MTRHDTITLYRAPDGWRWRYSASNEHGWTVTRKEER